MLAQERLLAGANPDKNAVSPGNIIIVAAHPDDETIGVGAWLASLPDAVIVHTTDGAPRDPRFRPSMPAAEREAYAAARCDELAAALALAGIQPHQIIQLGVVDMEAAPRAAELAVMLMDIFRALDPDLVISHPYEGGHPDHDATALAVHAAAALIQRRGERPPELAEMTSYHSVQGRFTTDTFLAGRDAIAAVSPSCWGYSRRLNQPARARKAAMFRAFATQEDVLRSFGFDVERVRAAPLYDFTRAPHRGALHYEEQGLPLSGERFRGLAKDALSKLDLAGAPL